MNPFELRNKLTDNVKKSMEDTETHINNVRKFIYEMIEESEKRASEHDASKLVEPELTIFAEYGPKLKRSTYGSEEYETFRKEMGVALDHHYKENRHHPEHFNVKEKFCSKCYKSLNENDLGIIDRLNECPYCGEETKISEGYRITSMNLIDLIELISDWKAASIRHDNGNIIESIEINQKRFGYSDDIKQILINTINDLGWK